MSEVDTSHPLCSCIAKDTGVAVVFQSGRKKPLQVLAVADDTPAGAKDR